MKKKKKITHSHASLTPNTHPNLQINENGLITFDVEFPEFDNVPFPLEFAAIAPFYSNIDTTNANENTSITIGVIDDSVQLDTASQLVQSHFLDGYQFRALSIVVATWHNVGHYRKNNEHQNTFQVSVIDGDWQQQAHRFLQSQTGDLFADRKK